MGSDVSEVQDTIFPLSSIKVHFDMCIQILRLVDRISHIVPDIEAARPGSSGKDALCQLQSAMDKAGRHVQSCCESSKLYLALTADTVVSRFGRTKCLIQQNLSELQTMVPVALGFKISEIVDDLRDTVFSVNPYEAEASKAIRALLQESSSNSVETSKVEILQFAASRLQLSSHKDILAERRTLQRLLEKLDEGKSVKRSTLKHLLYLLKKYEKQIVQGQTRTSTFENDASSFVKTLTTNTVLRQVYARDNGRASMLENSDPPEEFICPLSLKLMCDPVIISSGQTFERTSIEKWFDEGHDTCPTTKLKLANLSVIPNSSLKDLISKWSTKTEIYPRIQTSSIHSHKPSSDSICSTASSMNDLHLRLDISNISLGSLGSLDNSYNSDISHTKVEKGFSLLRETSSDKFKFFSGIQDIERQFLSDIGGLSWELQCRAVQDVQDYLSSIDPSCSLLSLENFLVPLVQFLKDGADKHDSSAQKTGSRLLLTFLKSSRKEAVTIGEDLYSLLVYNLGKGVSAEMLAIMEILSAQENAFSNFAASGALTSTLKFLDDGSKKEYEEAAISALYNLSSNFDTNSCKLALDWIPKLVPFMRESSFAGTCLGILENFCRFEEGRLSIAGTNGCIKSIVDLLESGSFEDQEYAVRILLSLCAQRDHYCYLVLHEGVVPPLCFLSQNGNDKAKIYASELLRLLRDIRHEEEEEAQSVLYVDEPDHCPVNLVQKPASKKLRFLEKKINWILRKNC